ncbi:MAG: RnfABCDGE type electron transport complex subunit G [Candidatus Omnitrophota bacterium]|nr:RnfABCDGE type electron transport complex subunit G [Candidatus Omnitrophota bacterium]
MKKSLHLIMVLTFVCVLAGLSLALVNSLTKGRIEAQEKGEILSAVSKILPMFNNDPLKDTKEIDGIIFFIGKYNGCLTGVACEAEAEGYNGSIRVMAGMDSKGEINGVEILQNLETPGLGSRIENLQFRMQFKNRSLANSKLVKGNLAVKKDRGDIDSLSGATISSRAVTRAVSRALHLFQKNKKIILNTD